MTLNLPISKPLEMGVVRELGPEDVVRFEELGPGARPEPALKRLRSRHHAVARLIAEGYKHTEAAALVGITPQSIHLLMKDPSFQELVQHYISLSADKFVEVSEKLAGLAEDAIDVMTDRLEDDPDSVESKDLIKLIETAADRTGLGPTSTQLNINAELGSKLDAARARVAARRAAAQEAEVVEGASLGASSSAGQGPSSASLPSIVDSKSTPPDPD